jgi:DnaK suppressor protein
MCDFQQGLRAYSAGIRGYNPGVRHGEQQHNLETATPDARSGRQGRKQPLKSRPTSKEPVTVKKSVAEAKPVSKLAVKKTAAARQAAPAEKRVSSAKSAKAAAPKKVRPVKSSAKTAKAKSSSTLRHSARTVPAASTSTPMTTHTHTHKHKTDAAPAAAAASAPTAASPTTAAAPATATRVPRVSRLSQLTVPSMPQSVASTAAKHSFAHEPPSKKALVLPPTFAVKKDPKLVNNWKTKTAAELTDQEVIAMPDSEYMNEKQMAFFRLKLVELKRGILENAGETTEHLREDTVVVPDPADRATIEEEHALELRTRDRERKLLKKIEQSIQRIDAGDYGYCDETGEPIGAPRLIARPTATLSLEAQQRRELKQKMFGD